MFPIETLREGLGLSRRFAKSSMTRGTRGWSCRRFFRKSRENWRHSASTWAKDRPRPTMRLAWKRSFTSANPKTSLTVTLMYHLQVSRWLKLRLLRPQVNHGGWWRDCFRGEPAPLTILRQTWTLRMPRKLTLRCWNRQSLRNGQAWSAILSIEAAVLAGSDKVSESWKNKWKNHHTLKNEVHEPRIFSANNELFVTKPLKVKYTRSKTFCPFSCIFSALFGPSTIKLIYFWYTHCM